jgi:small ligand-binding sensory domain FIST
MPNTASSRLILAKYAEPLVIETARSALAEVGGRVSCGFVFCSADYRENLPDFLELLQLHAHIPILLGCSGSGIIGADAEAEMAQGFSLLLMHLPETELFPFSFDEETAPEWDDGPAWREVTGVKSNTPDAWILLADPASVPIEPWLAAWSEAFPGVPCIGGLASGGREGSDIFVFRDRELLEGGGIALGFRGGVKLHTLVSQGCRPIGEALPVTGVEHNVIQSLGSRPAYKILDEAYQGLTDREKEHARGNLFAGLAMREDLDEFHRGDFLIRNILGADETSGAVAVGAFPRVGQTVQWQLRDRKAADDDLRRVAGRLVDREAKPFASLLFSCGGRGRNLFGAPNHDAGVIAEVFGTHASAGFFCNGEIGPVGGKNFVHGYTASAALFC